MRYLAAALLGLAVFQSPQNAHAQHSDIELEFHDGQIEVEFGPEGAVFEGEIETGGLTPNETSEPGFETHEPVGAGNLVGFNVHGPLLRWDGTQFVSPGAAVVNITDNLSNVTSVDASTTLELASFTLPGDKLLGEDDFHFDPTYEIVGGTPGNAYGIVLSLSTNASGIADSAKFGLLFNYGSMDENLFEAGVEALAARVPEPAALLLLPLAGLTTLRVRKKD